MDANFYLKNLVIQNFATFKNQSIRFRPGFNAIIGETGSGKSLVLEALQLILGGRADKKTVRRETEYALIEASFHCEDSSVRQFLEHEGYPLEGQDIVIKRLIYANGSTKNYINHLSCTVSFLAQFSKRHIDLVGQHENQKLLAEAYQLHLLDFFSKHQADLFQYQTFLKEYKSYKQKQTELLQSKNLREQRLDYLHYQLQEIEKLDPSSQDEEDLLRKKSMVMNLEKNQKLSFQVKDIFEGNENSLGLHARMRALNSLLLKNADLFGSELTALATIDDDLSRLNQELEHKLSTDIDPSEMEHVLERLDFYQRLKKKFGGSVEAILQSEQSFKQEKQDLEELDINFEGLELKITLTLQKLQQLADKLHQNRLSQSKKLSLELTKKVQELKMQGASLKIQVEKTEDFTETGISRVNFIAQTNPGEGFFKIKDIASGGELSRILLAVRQILSSYDSIGIFLFDEIDTGIGGETANCIGKALAQVALHGQVIAITHLPQIAQFAEVLIMVNKDIQRNKKEARTESFVKEVIGKSILKEVKAMTQLS